MNMFTKIFGDESSRYLKSISKTIVRINEFEPLFEALSVDEIKGKTQEFKQRIENGESLDGLLPEAFALVREATKRTLGMRQYDVQMIGGMVLHDGKIAEMRTGEGKTLAATLPVYLNALEGKGVHVVTVNDYLARRDTQWMGQIYDALGMTIAVINSQQASFLYDGTYVDHDQERDAEGSYKIFDEFLKPCTRKEAYQADITYGTNNEFGFDYLRDNTVGRASQLSGRGYHFVIVDEIDSILIDEARVPLILSTQGEDAEDTYRSFSRIAQNLEKETDYTVDEKLRAVQLTDSGIGKAEKALKIQNMYRTETIQYVHHLETAVRAHALFQRDVDYVVKDDQVIIVDPFTGRMQEGRRWSDGLHQAIEAKEAVAIKQESKTLASVTYQNYFKFYDKLSGMTGTAQTSAEEFGKVYNLDVITVPTNKTVIRDDKTDLIFQNEKGKFKAIARDIKEINKTGQPILVGTVSIEKNELLSAFLAKEGVKHQMLNAKQHEKEGMVVAEAGKKGAVTIATNMAGRGVDIKLGGPGATKEQEQEVKDLGGLHVIGTERHDARRIDNQLRGRSGRQGDPGSTQFYVSLEDNLMRIFGGDRVKGMIGALGIAEDEAIKNKFISRQLESAQEKIEGFHFDSRKHILDFDDVLSFHRTLVYNRRRKILLDDRSVIDALYQQVLDVSGDQKEVILAKKKEIGEEVYWPIAQRLFLYLTDRLWMEHLEVMENTRRSVNLRAYGQHEPLVEYKRESLRLFGELEQTLKSEAGRIFASIDVKAVKGETQKTEEDEDDSVKETTKKDVVRIRKGGEVREVKEKKLQQYLDTGWSVLE